MKGSWVAVVALALGACVPDFAERGDAPVLLVVTQVEATAGGEGTGGAFLGSDVRDTKGGEFNDSVAVTLENVPKNGRGVDPGRFNDAIIESFEVKYFRTDGRNVEGVDVPYRITGGVTAFIPSGGTGEVAFTVVRHTAKEEPPLTQLADFGGSKLLTVTAQITLYGHTTGGKAVSATANLQITFGNFVKA